MFKTFVVSKEFDNTRIDKWFKNQVKDIPNSLIQKFIRTKKIKLNDKKTTSSIRVKYQDKITIFNLENIENRTVKFKKKYVSSPAEQDELLKVVEDNKNFIVLNKPAGLPTQSGTKALRNLVDILKTSKYFSEDKPFIVHRLDKETSGIILFAKNRKYAQLFTSLFRLRKIHKTYLAICNNQFNSNEKNLKDNLIYYEKNRQIIQKAETTVNVLDSNTKYSLLELNPITGRKHQLRKQLAVRDCPIVGDNKYNIKYKNSNFKHLMLHAYSLKFKINERKYSYYISPDEKFLNLLKKYNFKLNKFS